MNLDLTADEKALFEIVRSVADTNATGSLCDWWILYVTGYLVYISKDIDFVTVVNGPC
jgi:hypothetical protein